jgi:hypothetical protein
MSWSGEKRGIALQGWRSVGFDSGVGLRWLKGWDLDGFLDVENVPSIQDKGRTRSKWMEMRHPSVRGGEP